MPRITRLHFAGIGHRDARFPALTLDLRGADGLPADSVIWAENGVGKSSLLTLFFSNYQTNRRQFLGARGVAKARELEDYVQERDLSFILTEWDITDDRGSASLLADEPRELLVVGQVLSWKGLDRGSGELRRRFFSFRPNREVSFDHLPVIKGGKLFGMITSADLLNHMLPAESPRDPMHGEERVRFDFEVATIADENVIEVEPDTRLATVIDTVREKKSTYVLVTLWGELQGIITLRDLVQLLIRKRKTTKAPYYIVGLPNEPFEAESAKMKMDRLGAVLTKSFPYIEEIRAVVKSKENRGPRRRYEVTVSVYTPRMMHSYVEQGYDLSEIFDGLVPVLKRLLSSKQSKVTKTQGASIRKTREDY